MKFLLSGMLMPVILLSASEPFQSWNFDRLNARGLPVNAAGTIYYGALVAKNMGTGNTNGLLCDGTKRNHIVQALNFPEWTVELKFKLNAPESTRSRTLFAYEHLAWNLSRFLLFIDRNGRITGDFRRLKMPEKTIEKTFVFSSNKLSWQADRWYTVRVASKSGGPARIWLDGVLVAGKDNALALADLNDGKNYKWYPQISLGCNPSDPSRASDPLQGVVDDLKIWKSYEEPATAADEMLAVSGTDSGSGAEKYLVIAENKPEWSEPFQILDKESAVAGDYRKADDKFLKNGSRAGLYTKDGTLHVLFRCPVPAGMKLAAGKSDSLWKECVEFFFRPDAASSVYYQYAAGANGKFEAMRYTAALNLDPMFRSRAVCNVSAKGNGYTVEIRIPLAEIGLDKGTPGMSATGNFTRQGASCGGLATWAPVGSNFHNPEQFGRLILASRKAYFIRRITELKEQLAKLNPAAEVRVPLEKKLAEAEKFNSVSGDNAQAFAKLENQLNGIRKSLVSLRLSGASMLLWKPDVWGNDIEVSMVSRPLEKIKLVSAVNSRILYGFAVSNLSEKPFLGQIKLFPGVYPSETSENSFSSDSGFHEPFSNVKILEGISQMNSAGTVLYDAMAPLPLNTLLRIPPKTTVPLWMEFSSSDLPAGIYSGTLVLKPAYPGFELGKIPFELEVLPIDLGKVSAKNFNYTYLERPTPFLDDLRKRGGVSPLTRFLAEHGVNFVFLADGLNYPKVDKDGNIGSADFSQIDRQFDDLIASGIPLKDLSACFYLAACRSEIFGLGKSMSIPIGA